MSIPTSFNAGSKEGNPGTHADLPGYDAPTFTIMPVGFTSRRFVKVSGFDDIGRLSPPCRLVSASCSSGQRFAFGLTARDGGNAGFAGAKTCPSDSTSRWTPLPFG
jgi:hypothetical protein